MKIRKITSITASLAFMLMVLTSIILYIVPQGRVAYWADWRLWGLSKTEWGNIHINLGLLFLIALFLHIYYNWKPLMSYLKNKSKELKVFTPEFNVSLVITVAFIVGTYTLVPPFNWVMTLNDHFKESGAEKYGEPPYGHAELSSLKTFTRKMNLDLNKSVALLDQAGYPIEGQDETLAAIGRRHHIPPQRVYETIESAKNDSPAVARNALPDTPPAGSGNLTLADFCAQFNLNMKELVRELKQRNISASEQSTLKEIAADNSTSPVDIYQAIREIIAG